jgi:tRNA G10  N-methylase Trm11
MKIAILGRQPAIGIAELESVFGGENLRVLGTQACLIEAEKINISHFGSILKTGEVAFEVNSLDWRAISKQIVQIFERDFADFAGKITLGISTYGISTSGEEVTKTAQIIKQKLRTKGVSVRVISSKTPALSTATSHNNKLGLSEKKIEILAVAGGKKTVIALSEGAQNITAYAKRDQNRPRRDAFVGMLPPKLAQTMINLGIGANQPQIAFLAGAKFPEKMAILDPFCGTGTVLQEAILKGFTAHGTDLSDKMIDYSRENLAWLAKEFRPFGKIGEIHQADATTAHWDFADQLQSVVCETYL